jgi:N utilization substance protein A
VEIKAIAREPGSRSKVAVASRQEGLDPVGATVGQRGARVQSVVAELGGEKIDVIPWSDDPAVFVANALSPAQVLGVDIDEEHRIASITVPERMLSLAIGREGQNARLAAKLTGWRIDIRSDVSVAEAKAARASAADASAASGEGVPAAVVADTTPADGGAGLASGNGTEPPAIKAPAKPRAKAAAKADVAPASVADDAPPMKTVKAPAAKPAKVAKVAEPVEAEPVAVAAAAKPRARARKAADGEVAT